MVIAVLSLVAVGFAIALPATIALVRVGRGLGALDSAGAVGHAKAGLRSVPNVGGIAIFLAVFVPLAGGLLAVALVPADRWDAWLPSLVPHLGTVRASTPTALALLGGMLVLHLMGVVDDRRGLPAIPKLLVQLAVAAVLAIWFDVRLLELLGPAGSVAVTVAWIVVITNAINFLDNMDGLAAGVSAIAGSLLLVATILNEQWFIAATLALLIGGLLGFLVLNAPPARIFMGDGGSLVVGFLLAVLTARTTFYNPEESGYALGSGWYAVFMPVVILAVPLYDFTTVTLIRLAQGKSPFVGDQQHFSHRLVARGLSTRGAVAVIWGATAVTGIGGISLGRLEPWQAVLVGVQTALVLMVIALLEHASRRAVGRRDPEEPAA